MKQSKLTKWQVNHKKLLEAALQNLDFYNELSYMRRDTFSPLKTTESQFARDGRLLKLMDKYGVRIEAFRVLESYCAGNELDYTLIEERPVFREKYYAERDNFIYQMWMNGRGPTEISKLCETKKWQVTPQFIGVIVGRMRDKDVNRRGWSWSSKNRK